MRRYLTQKETRQQRGEGGFTIIEILIAMVIFSMGILSIGLLQEQSAFSNIYSGNLAANVTMSTDRLEKLMSLEYDDSALSPDPTDNPHIPNLDADSIDNNGDGQIDEDSEDGQTSIRWNVVETNPKPGSDLYNFKTVTVTINRDGFAGSNFVALQRSIPNIVGD